MELDFEIDKITESIENAETGETLNTLVLPVSKSDLKEVTKKNGWLFNWKFEYDQTERQVYKLVAKNEPQTIHGLVSLEKRTGHVFMTLIENAPFNSWEGKKVSGCGLQFDRLRLQIVAKIFPQNAGGIMIAIDTQEKLDWIMNALEDREIVLDNRKRTKKDDDEICRAIADYNATRQETLAPEAVLA
jgi:hypothetical protein